MSAMVLPGEAGRLLRLGDAVDRLEAAMRRAVAETTPRRVTDVYVTERLLGIMTYECSDEQIDRIVTELDVSTRTVDPTAPSP
jgi:hypothetical protein